jgi:hypothetical protein
MTSDGPERSWRASPAKRMAATLALIFAGVLAAFVITEAAVRLTGLAKTSFYVYDAERGWAPRPGAEGWQRDEGEAYLKFNREGFRGPEYPLQKPEGTLRIAVVGDSYTEAQQVPFDRTFCSVAQRELAERLAGSTVMGMTVKRVEVLNFGVDGYGTAQELMTLDDHVWQYSPDIVVLAVMTGNDIRNNSVVLEGDKCRPFYVYRDNRLMLGGPFCDSRIFRAQCWLRFESRHFQVLNLLGDARSAIRERLRQSSRKRTNPGVGKPVGSERGLNDIIYQEPSTSVWREAWRVTDGEIELMHHEVAERGAMFLVVTMANGIQVLPNPAAREKYMKWLGVNNLFYPEFRIKALGERDGFAVLNPALSLQAYADEHHVYIHGFKNTRMGAGHWNELGHRLAGKLIAEKLYEMIEQRSAAGQGRGAVASAIAAAAKPAPTR